MTEEKWIELVVGIVLGALALWRHLAAAKAAIEAKDLGKALGSVIEGVEDLERDLPETAGVVKQRIRQTANVLGAAEKLHAEVKKRFPGSLTPSAPPAAGGGKVAGLLLLAALAAGSAGCSLVGGPSAEEWGAASTSVELAEQGVAQAHALHRQSLEQFRDLLRAEWHAAIDQAGLDELHFAERYTWTEGHGATGTEDGKLTTEEAAAIAEVASRLKREAEEKIQRAFEAGLEPKSWRDVREVLGSLKFWIAARRGGAEVTAEVIGRLREAVKGTAGGGP